MQALKQYFRNFAREEDGAQILEYALIVAVISLALIYAMATLANTNFQTWITKVGTCLSTGVCTKP